MHRRMHNDLWMLLLMRGEHCRFFLGQLRIVLGAQGPCYTPSRICMSRLLHPGNLEARVSLQDHNPPHLAQPAKRACSGLLVAGRNPLDGSDWHD